MVERVNIRGWAMNSKTEPEKPKKGSSFKEWWDENKDGKNAARRKRYAEDEEFRERQKAAARKNQRDRYKPADGRTAPGLRPRMVQVRGERVAVYSMAYLAEAIGYTTASVKRWVRTSVIPKPTHVDEMGRNWFSSAYVDFIRECVEKFRGEDWSLRRFSILVTEEWKKRGIV